MESVISSIKDNTSSECTSGLQETKLSWSRSSAVSRTTRLRSLFLDSKKRSFDGVGHQQCQRRHVFAVYFLDSKKRCFDGVGHQQCQGRHVFGVYFWTPRNEGLVESVISSIKDGTSSQFISGLQETKLSRSRSSAVSRTTRLRSLSLDSKKHEALMESVISSVKDDTSSQFISGLQETKL